MSQCYIVMLTNVCLTNTIVVIVYIVVMIYIVVYSSQPTTVQIHLVALRLVGIHIVAFWYTVSNVY